MSSLLTIDNYAWTSTSTLCELSKHKNIFDTENTEGTELYFVNYAYGALLTRKKFFSVPSVFSVTKSFCCFGELAIMAGFSLSAIFVSVYAALEALLPAR